MFDETYIEKPIDKLVYSILCMYADNSEMNSYPKIATIAKKAVCSENTVRAALKRLKALALIDVEERKTADGRNLSNIYFILDPPSAFEENAKPTDMRVQNDVG